MIILKILLWVVLIRLSMLSFIDLIYHYVGHKAFLKFLNGDRGSYNPTVDELSSGVRASSTVYLLIWFAILFLGTYEIKLLAYKFLCATVILTTLFSRLSVYNRK